MTPALLPEGAPYRKIALAAALAWTAAIFVACLWPGKELPHSDIPFIDKWTHFVLFGIFSFLWLCACPPPPEGQGRRFLLIILVAIALGCLVEGLQTGLPRLGRSGDMVDALADAVGGVLGAGAYQLARTRIFRVKE